MWYDKNPHPMSVYHLGDEGICGSGEWEQKKEE
jgi:hypothetical protein